VLVITSRKPVEVDGICGHVFYCANLVLKELDRLVFREFRVFLQEGESVRRCRVRIHDHELHVTVLRAHVDNLGAAIDAPDASVLDCIIRSF